MKKKKKWLPFGMAAVMAILPVMGKALPVHAQVILTSDGVETSNVGAQAYKYNWASVVNSYLVDNQDGTYTRVEYNKAEKNVLFEKYSSEWKRLSLSSIACELPIFGGFYESDENYFLIFGQSNEEESDGKEVMRVVKYDKALNRLSSASVYGANTTVPFDAGSLRCTDDGDTLFIRTCHTMYTSSDGLNHQANMTFAIDMASMQVAESAFRVENTYFGYASHSFNQFIEMDGTDLIAVDHGDAYPRSAVLFRYDREDRENRTGETDTLSYYGRIGENRTNATIGGLGISSTSYLIAGTSAIQDANVNSAVQNIYVSVTDKKNFSKSGTKISWITNYDNSEYDVKVTPPYLVKTGDQAFMLLWQEPARIEKNQYQVVNKDYNKTVNYVMLNGNGTMTSAIQTMRGTLSDCEPIVSNGRVFWYATEGSSPAFYSIDATGKKDPDPWKQDTFGWWFEKPDGAYANGWQQHEGNWYFFDGNGYMVTGWKELDSQTYHFSTDGYMDTDWVMIDGKWYYFGKNGILYRNATTPDGYQVDENGELVTRNTWWW